MTSIGNVLLLSNDPVLNDETRRILNMYLVVCQQFNLTELISYMKKHNPIAVIVDVDDYDYSVCKSIIVADSDNCIPVLALGTSDKRTAKSAVMPMEYYMRKVDMGSNLYNTVKIFTDFKRKYVDIKQCYNINDLINSETDCLLKKFTENDSQDFNPIEHLLNTY